MVIADIFAFAREKKTIDGTFELGNFARLNEALTHTKGCVRFTLSGILGKNRKVAVLLAIEGDFPLICQRCLEEMNFHLNHSLTLELAKEDFVVAEEGFLEEDYEIFPTPPKVDLSVLVEDEIILALPNFPRHDFCRSFDYGRSTE